MQAQITIPTLHTIAHAQLTILTFLHYCACANNHSYFKYYWACTNNYSNFTVRTTAHAQINILTLHTTAHAQITILTLQFYHYSLTRTVLRIFLISTLHMTVCMRNNLADKKCQYILASLLYTHYCLKVNSFSNILTKKSHTFSMRKHDQRCFGRFHKEHELFS
jgi:hypothetical protein